MGLLRRLFKKLGYEIVPTSVTREVLGESTLIYERLKPNIRFAPWNSEEEFERLYDRVKHATMVDKVRCFELWRLVAQSAKLGEGCLLEVGVWRGGTGALIARRAAECGVEDTVYLCDTFAGVVKAGERDPWYRGREHADASAAAVEEYLAADMGLRMTVVLAGSSPMKPGSSIPDERCRFCSHRRRCVSVCARCLRVGLAENRSRRPCRFRRLRVQKLRGNNEHCRRASCPRGCDRNGLDQRARGHDQDSANESWI